MLINQGLVVGGLEYGLRVDLRRWLDSFSAEAGILLLLLAEVDLEPEYPLLLCFDFLPVSG